MHLAAGCSSEQTLSATLAGVLLSLRTWLQDISSKQTLTATLTGFELRLCIWLQDGSSKQCDILVVADGASSKIRADLLPDEQPKQRGYVSIKVSYRQLNVCCWFPLLLASVMFYTPG